MKKESPMLFKGAMVRGILDLTKWQTRRIISPQPEFEGVESFGDSCKWRNGEDWFSGVTTYQLTHDAGLLHPTRAKYQIGMILWAKETFRLSDYNDCACYEPCSCKSGVPIYRATCGFDREEETDPTWTPSIFMRREYSRINLEITDVRVQRVSDISEEDAKAEGIFEFAKTGIYGYDRKGTPGDHCYDTARGTFECLWNSINGKPSPVRNKEKQITHYESFPFSGESRTEQYRGKPHIITCNVWVWAISFKKL